MLRFAMPALLVLGAAAAAASASAPHSPPPAPQKDREAAKLAKALSGMTAGAPIRCLPMRRMVEMRTFDGTILYLEGRNRAYRNDVVGQCSGLARGDLVVSINPGGIQCEGNIIRTRERTSGMFTGSCSLGRFVPYSKDAK